MSTSVNDIDAVGYEIAQFLTVFLSVNVVYIFAYAKSHVHIHDATNMLIILFFWIKLLVKLAKFLTIQKRDRRSPPCKC
jgi:hypothetical protein